jgi:hypothetical protein
MNPLFDTKSAVEHRTGVPSDAPPVFIGIDELAPLCNKLALLSLTIFDDIEFIAPYCREW